MRNFSQIANVVLMAGGIAAIDQASKTFALTFLEPHVPMELMSFVDLRLGFNTGFSFGMLATDENTFRLPLVFVTLVIVAIVAGLAIQARGPERVALSAVVGGGTGNLVDRIARGRVTDFLDIHAGSWHWPAFNLADSAISIGAAVFVWLNLLALTRRNGLKT